MATVFDDIEPRHDAGVVAYERPTSTPQETGCRLASGGCRSALASRGRGTLLPDALVSGWGHDPDFSAGVAAWRAQVCPALRSWIRSRLARSPVTQAATLARTDHRVASGAQS